MLCHFTVMGDSMTERQLTPKLIDGLYVEAMVLADEARSYFDTGGRDDRLALDPLDRVGFSCESLKVTTRLMHVIAWLLTLLIPVTRWFALSRTPWDSDEGLFISALKHYDVHLHHPHPPGFPLFIATAKIFTAFGVREFRALQLVAAGASCLIVPAMI